MTGAANVTVASIRLAATPVAWCNAGFRVDGGQVAVGSVALALIGSSGGRGIVDCELRGIASEELDGLPISRSEAPTPDPAPPHPNGVTRIDHVVAFTPDLDRTVRAGQALGLDLRRVRDEPAPAGSPRQAFFRLGEVILELAQAPPGSPIGRDDPARFYGLAFVVEDLDATVAGLGDLVGSPREAIQPGRRIATVTREAGLGLPVALMTEAPRDESDPPPRRVA